MIINELAYKVTIKADEFLNGKRKVKQEAQDLKNEIERSSSAIERSTTSSMSKTAKETDKAAVAMKGLTASFNGFLGLSTRFVAVGGVLTAVAIGIHRAFESTSESIVRASNMGRMLGTSASNVLGTQYGFSRIGQNGGAFLGAQMSARMALANIEDPTIFGRLTPEAQNLLTTGARTGIDISKLGGKSEDALAEFQKYGKNHNEKQLMQVLSAFGYDPNLAGDIKSGKAVQMVSEEEKRWQMTKEQEEAQRNILATTKALDSQFAQVKQELMATFGPEVLKAEQEFLEWLKNNKGDIVGFFRNLSTGIDGFVKAVGGAGNALGILAAMALLSGKGLGSKLTGGALPPWLAGLTAYGLYLYNDRENIEAAAKGSFNYSKRELGDTMRSMGFDTDFGRRGDEIYGNNIQPDIPLPDGVKPVSMDSLLDAIREVESSGGKKLYSPKGAVGPYQFMKDTAIAYGLKVGDGIDERLDEVKSRAAAERFMRDLLKHYKGNVNHALMAYNWGMGNVDKKLKYISSTGFDSPSSKYWNTLPKETREYVPKIRAALNAKENETLAYYQQQQRIASTPSQTTLKIDNSRSSSTTIGTVVVNSNPTTVDALTRSVNQQVSRVSTNAAFSSGVTP
ncbi:transglycosylase SLT domain-containing protein [Escherichia coli]|nr:transglycosylase SLT domain-containing protein [Escherichia coli]